MYYIASLKLSGWMSQSYQYTTDISQARKFSRDEALEMCRRQKAGGNSVILVSVEDMEAIA